jgi:preprotein translocase subunit SecY
VQSELAVFGRAFRTPDVRTKILFALAMIALYRIGAFVPTPGVDYPAVQRCLTAVEGNSVYDLINLFSGGALLQLSIFALGIMPYITASIILQLLTVVIPRLETLKKEGQSGQAKITQYTRYLTMGLAVLQATGIIALARSGQLLQGCNEELLVSDSLGITLTMIAVMTAGTGLVMWLGELITDRGIGNGMSLLIFTSIVAGFPGQLAQIASAQGSWTFAVVLGVGVAVVAFVVLMEQGQRRVPVQYAKRMVGRRQYGGTSTYIPIKVNQAGVIPVIFASSMLYLPVLWVTISNNQGAVRTWVEANIANGNGAWYAAIFFGLTVFFTYFYVAITFNAEEVADNMKKYGGFIPGIRAGAPTAQYLDYVLSRLTAVGSVYLASIAVIPIVVFSSFGQGQNFLFGGTSILIMVGVGLDTVKQIESQLQQRSYEGFMR